MEFMGIKFAPLFVPFHRRMQTLAAAAWFITIALGGVIGLIVTLYNVFFTRYWWLFSLYLLWSWVLDKDTCSRGGRRIPWVRRWTWWKYVRDYFPTKLVKADGVNLDPQKNYLFCSFPHAIMPAGAFIAYCTDAGGFANLFPGYTCYQVALTQQYYMPFFRELMLSFGGCASSSSAIRYILDRGPGNVVAIMVGGAQEAFFCRPGNYTFLIKKRRGFVKLALQTGSPLVPVISFGETDSFDQVGKDDSTLRRIQDKLRKVIGLAPVIPIGRGFFQYSFGLIPRRKPVTTVVGKPVEVKKTLNPTKEEIDEVHTKFCQQIAKLFEDEKYKYLENPETTFLIIE